MSNAITPAATQPTTRPRRRPRLVSAWGTDIATLRRFGYPVRRVGRIDELEGRVDALEAAIAAGTDVDLGGAR